MRKQPTISFVPLQSSDRADAPGEFVAPIHGNSKMDISVQLPMVGSLERIANAVASGRRHSDREIRRLLGARRNHVRKVTKAALAAGLVPQPRTAEHEMFGIIRLEGRYGQFKRFFPQLEVNIYKDDKGQKVAGRVNTINIQMGLPIVGVFGFDDRDVAHHNYVVNNQFDPTSLTGEAAPASQFPSPMTARGQAQLTGVPVGQFNSSIGIVSGYLSLGGDNGKMMQADVARAAKHDGINLTGQVVGPNVDGTKLEGDYSDQATVENILDMLQHRLNNPNGTCAVFACGNSDDSFARGGEAAVAWTGVKIGTVLYRLLTLSISWGMAATNNTDQSRQRWARIFLAARLKGLQIVSATGDSGSDDNTDAPTADSPSDTPNEFGGAGVYVKVGADGHTIVEIGVWNDMADGGGATGGGIALFPVQPEESQFNLPVSKATGQPGHNASTLSDIAAPACGPILFYQGKFMQVGGTSNAAPAIAIKLALIQSGLKNQITDMVAFVFTHFAKIVTQITVAGNNGDYDADPSTVYNVPTGFGMINFPAFVAVAQQVQDGIVANEDVDQAA